MAPKKKTEVVSQDEFEAALKSEVVEKPVFNPDTTLLGIAKTDTGFVVLKVRVDSKTGVSSNAETLDTAENKWEANEKFKIRAIKEGVL